MAAVFDLVKYINTNTSEESSAEYLKKLLERLTKLCDVLGLIVDKEEEMLAEDIEKMIEERQAARKAKDLRRQMLSGTNCWQKGSFWKIREKA